MGAEMVAALEGEERYQRGLEQAAFINGDIHLLARRIARGAPPRVPSSSRREAGGRWQYWCGAWPVVRSTRALISLS